MQTNTRSWATFLAGLGITLILAGLAPLWIVNAQEATPEATPQPSVYTVQPMGEITGSNSYCLLCHSLPNKSTFFADGTRQNLYVDAKLISVSAHGATEEHGTIGCVDCHGADSFPHQNNLFADKRDYRLKTVSVCASCHTDQVTDLQHGLHEKAILAGNREAAVCTDCHGAHEVKPVIAEKELLSTTCGDCHTASLAEWQISAHNTLDNLGCTTCHSPHTQSLRVGTTADELCMNCHKEPEEQLIHAQHRPESGENVACVDCHMQKTHITGIHPIPQNVSLIDRNAIVGTGHTMLMDTTPCITCHTELVANGEWGNTSETVSTETHTTTTSHSTPTTDNGAIQLMQGLLLGLGFGASVAVVFVTRGQRTPTVPVAVSPVAPPITPTSHLPMPAEDDTVDASTPKGDK